jgi:hypothetical protein
VEESRSKPPIPPDEGELMSTSPFDTSFEAFREQKKSEERLRLPDRLADGLTERFCDLSRYLLRLRIHMRSGRLSRMPMQLMRVEILPERAEFDCLARAGDPWDADIAAQLARRHVTLQVLHDAIDLRAILFRSMPGINSARIRIYRESEQGGRELIMFGDTHRNDHTARGVHSLTMRAKILGFRFGLDNEHLKAMKDSYPTSKFDPVWE